MSNLDAATVKATIDMVANDVPGARMLAIMSLTEVLAADAALHEDELNEVAKGIVGAGADRSRKVLVNKALSYLENGRSVENLLVPAAYTTMLDGWVSKKDKDRKVSGHASWGSRLEGAAFNARVKRDAAGRFARSTSGAGATSGSRLRATNKDDKDVVNPGNIPDEGTLNTAAKKAKADAYAEAYNRVHSAIQDYRAQGHPDDSRVIYHKRPLQRGETGARAGNPEYDIDNPSYEDMGTLKDMKSKAANWDPDKEHVQSVSIVAPRGEGLEARGYQGARNLAYDALSPVSPTTASYGYAGVPTPKEFTQATENWMTPGEGRAYRRIGAAGEALSVLGTMGAPTGAAGALASAVGAYGPQAEKVFGPSFRRLAYRYRGVEKQPDDILIDRMPDLSKSNMNKISNEESEQLDAFRANVIRQARVSQASEYEGKGAKVGSDVKVMAHYASKPYPGASRDQLAMKAQRDMAIIELADQIPTALETQIGLASGQEPPSHGLMMDSKGHVVTQATGYLGDHYLPFNLKNMGAMNGGHYVRTRSTGGLTGEDIYATLSANGRQATVLSRSGMFTMEFDPSFRGTRRHNDKARRMIRTYEKILDSIKNSDQSLLYTGKLTPTQEQEIRSYAAAVTPKTGDAAADSAAYGKAYASARNNKIFELSNSGPSEEDITAEVNSRMANLQRQGLEGTANVASARKDVDRQVRDEMYENQVKAMRLDARGYYEALKALKAQFPYYIRGVEYKPINEVSRNLYSPSMMQMEHSRSATDRSYVMPGRIRPEGASVGYWDKRVEGSGKVKGHEAFYQGALIPKGQKAEEATEPTGSNVGPGVTPQAAPAVSQAAATGYVNNIKGQTPGAILSQIVEQGSPGHMEELRLNQQGLSNPPNPVTNINNHIDAGRYMAQRLVYGAKDSDETFSKELLNDYANDPEQRQLIDASLNHLQDKVGATRNGRDVSAEFYNTIRSNLVEASPLATASGDPVLFDPFEKVDSTVIPANGNYLVDAPAFPEIAGLGSEAALRQYLDGNPAVKAQLAVPTRNAGLKDIVQAYKTLEDHAKGNKKPDKPVPSYVKQAWGVIGTSGVDTSDNLALNAAITRIVSDKTSPSSIYRHLEATQKANAIQRMGVSLGVTDEAVVGPKAGRVTKSLQRQLVVHGYHSPLALRVRQDLGI